MIELALHIGVVSWSLPICKTVIETAQSMNIHLAINHEILGVALSVNIF